jgi:hypothetical protein
MRIVKKHFAPTVAVLKERSDRCMLTEADALHPQTLLAYGINGQELPTEQAHLFVFGSRGSSVARPSSGSHGSL